MSKMHFKFRSMVEQFHPTHEDEMPLKERWELTQELGRVMSDASEDEWCAGWLRNWENMVAHAYNAGYLSELVHDEELCTAIKTLYEKLGHWAKFIEYWDDGDVQMLEWYGPYWYVEGDNER